MWRVIWFFLGVTRLQVTGASPEWCLQRLAKARVPFHFCGKPDAFTAGIWILRRGRGGSPALHRAAGCECRVEERGGFPAIFGGLQRRGSCRNSSFSTLSRAMRPSRRCLLYTSDAADE